MKVPYPEIGVLCKYRKASRSLWARYLGMHGAEAHTDFCVGSCLLVPSGPNEPENWGHIPHRVYYKVYINHRPFTGQLVLKFGTRLVIDSGGTSGNSEKAAKSLAVAWAGSM